MAVAVTHATVATLPDEAGAEINKDQWNEGHTVTGLAAVATTGSYADLVDEPTLSSGTYTPSLFNVANVSASTAFQCQYTQVGFMVTVSGKVNLDPTLTATVTQLGIALPIASDFQDAQDCAGVAFASGIAFQGGAVLADTVNNRAQLEFVSGDVTDQAMYFIFQYEVI